MSTPLKMTATLFGKHPSSSEYLNIGPRSDFMNAVMQWVEKGYETLLLNRTLQGAEKCHHFAFLNEKQRTLICGSMKSSQDKRGRKYPLVIAVEVSERPLDWSTAEMLAFSKEIAKKITVIFQESSDLPGFKAQLEQLSAYGPPETGQERMPSALIMSEEFSEVKLFYRPLEIDDYIETVR